MDVDALLKALSDGWRPSSVFNKRNAFGQSCLGCEVSHDTGLNHHGGGWLSGCAACAGESGWRRAGRPAAHVHDCLHGCGGRASVFNRHMAVAQLVGGARQVEGRTMRRAGRDAQHGLRRGNDPHHRAVFDQSSTSPPRTSVPCGRNTPTGRPSESSASKRLFWRTSQSSSSVEARLSSTEAMPAPCGSSRLAFSKCCAEKCANFASLCNRVFAVF